MNSKASLIPGYATPEGTARFRGRFAARLPGHVRGAQNLWLSSIGLGTYLGEPSDACDRLYQDAVTRAAGLGVNVFDSAVNYRHQRSERSVGRAIAAMIAEGSLRRDEVFLSTKGGFLAFDAVEPADPAAYFQERFVDSGLVRREDVAAGCHVMTPAYLADQIEVSRRNFGVETLDLYYMHNPETQLGQVKRPEFYRRLKTAFAALEKAVADGKIRMYGTATWNAYRVAPEATEAISLAEVLQAAKSVGGADHHFRAVQLPLNLAMPEALTVNTQPLDGRLAPLLHAAHKAGLMVFASASILQGQLAQGLPPEFARHLQGLSTDAQRAIQFARSTPGVTCALVGMSRREHVEENLATASVAPLGLGEYRAIFAGGTSTAP
ncbi:MAG TPA: aldo/keto reductase [Terriglobia bacterium]|nr:aldo/keto reductase [Terriglobia bacterium]